MDYSKHIAYMDECLHFLGRVASCSSEIQDVVLSAIAMPFTPEGYFTACCSMQSVYGPLYWDPYFVRERDGGKQIQDTCFANGEWCQSYNQIAMFADCNPFPSSPDNCVVMPPANSSAKVIERLEGVLLKEASSGDRKSQILDSRDPEEMCEIVCHYIVDKALAHCMVAYFPGDYGFLILISADKLDDQKRDLVQKLKRNKIPYGMLKSEK